MRWTGDSGGNVEDRRGMGGGGGLMVGGGLGSLIIAAIVFFLGGDPSAILGTGSPVQNSPVEQRQLNSDEKKTYQFIDMLSAANKNTWAQIFEENNMGENFHPAKLVMFEGQTSSGCGAAQAAMGPFYCPNDETIYVDMSFFNELQQRFGAEVTDFTVAYVIGHEYGHHIQNLLGTLQQVNRARGQVSEEESNAISVATELQADFYAGYWAQKTNQRTQFLEPGDVDAALNAAAAVGDDNIQKRAQGYVNQESFTHGSSAQRKEWFMRGYQAAKLADGNTFDALLR